jgi:excisionase family DNA binding protein
MKETRPSSLTDRLLTLQNVADRCQVSSRTVRRWVDDGELIVHRLGRSIRIHPEDLNTFIKTRRQS